jgi:FkbM family methyltransferase
MRNMLSKLPNWLFILIKIVQYKIQIIKNRFISPELEFNQLDTYIRKGSTAIDIGANHGVYTRKMAKYAENVIAIEPVNVNFEILRSTTNDCDNVFIVKAAATSKACKLKIDVPEINGYKNLYQASISSTGQDCKGIRADSIAMATNVSLIKIDAEGHDYEALLGCEHIINENRPTVIIESDCFNVKALMDKYGYTSIKNKSPNTVYSCAGVV